VRLQLEPLEDRLVLSPTLIASESLPGAGSVWNFSRVGQNPSTIFADLNVGYPDDDGLDEILTPAGDMQLYAYRYDPANPGTPQLFQHYVLPPGAGQLLSTPAIVDLPSGRAVFIGTDKGWVYGWNARTGALLPGWPRSVGDSILGAITSGDLDGDGVPEIVVTSVNQFVTAFHANGSVMWRYNNDDSIFSGAVIADLNGDGRMEVVIGGDSTASQYYWAGGRITVLSADGRREWVKKTDQVIWSSPSVADLYGNGKLDIIVGTGYFYPQPPNGTFPGDQVYALDANGNTLWTYATSTNPAVDARVYSSPAIADLNGDGILDVVIGDSQGRIHAISGTGTPLWVTQAFPASPLYTSAVIADINGDGLPDVIMADSNGHLVGVNGQTGQIIWSNPDGQAHYNAAGVGHFVPGTSLQLGVLPVATNPAAGLVLSPSWFFLYDLGTSTLTPPWPMLRNNAENSAVARPDGFSTQLVTTLYQAALGRVTNSGELSGIWLPAMEHAPSLRPEIYAILSSSEARVRSIGGWYGYYLNRGADAGAITAIQGAMNAGVSYGILQANLAASLEAFNLAGGNYQAWVNYLYQKVMHRTPVQAEVSPWVQALSANQVSLLYVAETFFSSDEYLQKLIGGWYFAYAGLRLPPVDSVAAMSWDLRRGKTEEQTLGDMMMSSGDYVSTQREGSWIRAIYQDVLARSPAATETASWLNAMRAGVPYSTVAATLLESAEYKSILVNSWFIAYLHRDPTAAEGAQFVAALNSGVPRVTLINNLIASDEYFRNRAGGNLVSFINNVALDLQGHLADPTTIAYWTLKAQTENIRVTMPAAILGGLYAGEYFKLTITGWYYQYVRRFPNTPADQSRIITQLTPYGAQSFVDYWTAGGNPESIQIAILISPEYLQIALDKAFWTGQRWLA
jgi:hypothetical protein